jgi:hypothetical protein
LKKAEHEEAVAESAIHVYHQEGSREIFEGHEHLSPEPRFTATLDGTFDVDVANNVHLTVEKIPIPTISIKISTDELAHFQEMANGRDWKLVL